MDTIRFQFTGGMADDHEMNFYEAGRFQYGAARFIYTLEKFRQDGNVISKLSSRVHADIRVKAAAEGSFIQDVIIYSAPILAECSIQCTFQALLAHVWNIVLPTSKANDIAVELAKQEVKKAKEDTKQEKEHTKQLQAMAAVAKGQEATTKQMLDIFEYAVKNNVILHNKEYSLSTEEIKSFKEQTEAKLEREEIVSKNKDCIESIDRGTERLLAGQLKKSISDMTLPLKSSATGLNISDGENYSKKIVHLDHSTALLITQEREDDTPTVIRGSVKAYDVENGYGKFRFDELKRPIPFRVPSELKKLHREDILDAMKKDDVLVSMYFIRDHYGNPTTLVLDDILDNEAADDMRLTE